VDTTGAPVVCAWTTAKSATRARRKIFMVVVVEKIEDDMNEGVLDDGADECR